MSGTAAIGAPISGTVIAIDINGKSSPPATSTALGAFIVDVNGMTAPYFLNIVGTAGGNQVTLNSIATAAGQTVNITPLTDLIVSTAAGQPAGATLAALCAPVDKTACLSALNAAKDPVKLAAAVTAVTAMIAPLNTAGTNPLTGAFVANGTGLDAVLDQILVSPALSQGDQATITLIATSAPLGSVTLPTNSGGTSTTPPPAAATVLTEIKACLVAFSSLYPATGFSPPNITSVSKFVDTSVSFGVGTNYAAITSAMTTGGDVFVAGFNVQALGISYNDMSPLDASELAALTSTTSTSTTRVGDLFAARVAAGKSAIAFDVNGAPTSAWVQVRASAGGSGSNFKFVKNTVNTGCAGGWKLAGTGHVDMHMDARTSRFIDNVSVPSSPAKRFGRYQAVHINKSAVITEDATVTNIDVRGSGLTTFGTFTAATAGTLPASVKLKLITPIGINTAYRISDGGIGGGSPFYGNSEALMYCQDMSASSAGPAGALPVAATPCLNANQVSPGKVYVWTLNAGATPVKAFPYPINAVALSAAFAAANEANLFATFTGVSATSTLTALNALPLNTLLDGKVTYNYTIGTAYGAKMNHCGLVLNTGAGSTFGSVLNAEQNAVGQETTCTFTTAGLNSIGSLAVGNAFQIANGPVTRGDVNLGTTVLGNQATSFTVGAIPQ